MTKLAVGEALESQSFSLSGWGGKWNHGSPLEMGDFYVSQKGHELFT